MRFIISLGAIVMCLGAVCSTLLEQDYRLHFANFQITHNKSYSSIEEYVNRLNVFKQNLDMINAHNAKNLSWTLAVNEFADMTWDEFKATRLQSISNVSSVPVHHELTEVQAKELALPDFVDWRTKGVVNAVKNQQQCGSCWAFSAVSAIESACAMRTGTLFSLSEQELVDCSKNGGNGGCRGGYQASAFAWEQYVGGLCLENAYPYYARDGVCRYSYCQRYCPVRSYVNVQSGSETALKAAVAQQPVSVTIEADQQGFQFYKSGVFDGACGTNLDHAVVAVGYGVENGKMYWLVRNSWGQNWGDQGYIKLIRYDANWSGQCGIALQSVYPIV